MREEGRGKGKERRGRRRERERKNGNQVCLFSLGGLSKLRSFCYKSFISAEQELLLGIKKDSQHLAAAFCSSSKQQPDSPARGILISSGRGFFHLASEQASQLPWVVKRSCSFTAAFCLETPKLTTVCNGGLSQAIFYFCALRLSQQVLAVTAPHPKPNSAAS